jgi:hypothetical protein
MRDAAAKLDFERAALLRDQLLELKVAGGGAPKESAGPPSRSARGGSRRW